MNKTIPIFKLKSSWEPPDYPYPPLQKFLNNVLSDIIRLYQYPAQNKNNSTKTDIIALKELKNKQDIVIKPADKGGKIVLWPIEQYLAEATKQLSDTNYYLEQNEDHTIQTAFEICTFLTYLKAGTHIDDTLYEFLEPHNPPRTPIFYMLPKIHKPNNPGRPIISGIDSPTANLSVYLDYYLKPIVRTLPSYIKDTDHFLQTILHDNLEIPVNSILVTLDVRSLYTNIPQDEGTYVCLSALNEFYGTDLPLPLPHLKQFFDFILKYNYFRFDNKYYLQILGTAMGTTFAPNYSNIFLGHFEHEALLNAPHNFTPILWKRFIDDIFLIWTHGEDTLLQFHEYLNRLHPTIKFDITYSYEKINFLDTTIFLNPQQQLESTLHTKPTDMCALLHAESYHPESCKRSVIYSQALRYRRIITNDSLLGEHLKKLKENLIRRGYKLSDINKQFNKLRGLTQKGLLYRTKNNESQNNTLPFVITYNETSANIGKILHEHWKIIEQDEILKSIWPRPPILALRRNRNLRDHLVHTNYQSTE